MRVCNVVGARPNFMKIAPVMRALGELGVPQILVHTGQHYDSPMSQVFFDELGLPKPDIYLGVGSDSHAKQTAKVLVGFEEVCLQQRPDLVIVAGDVNSTLACGLVAAKLNIPVAHVEAGLRSGDRTMPEETNRILTDHLSELLFTTEASGNENLKKEGIPEERVFFVGNCMVDTLLHHREAAVAREPWREFSLTPRDYAVVTLHRPSNVDNIGTLKELIQILAEISSSVPILFPIHPRTRGRLKEAGIIMPDGIHLCDPLPYLKFIGLLAKARLVLTDSGGIQEETTVLSTPCLTMRWNTERPATLASGNNRLVGNDRDQILAGFSAVMEGKFGAAQRPPLWDGAAAPRTAQIIAEWLKGRGFPT